MHTARRLAATGAALCLLTGCQPAITPTPSPTPSYRCTPEAGGNEYNCTPFQHDDMIAKDKLYAEAEAVYRRYLAEDVRILRAGGVKTATPALLGVASGEFLADALTEYRSIASRKVTAKGDDPRLVYFTRAPGRTKGSSVVSATSCLDGSSLKFQRLGKTIGRGNFAKNDFYFARVDGAMKIVGADGSKVSSCDQ